MRATRAEAWETLTEYTKSEALLRHALAVEASVGFYARVYGEDEEFWRATALLHDFDYEIHPTLDQHPQDGAPILRELGYPELLCRFCSCHTGVGLSRADVKRQRLPLPVRDYLAGSDEERLVMYADKFHSKRTPPVFLTGDTYAASVGRWGEDKVTAFASLRAKYGEPVLGPLSESTGYPVI